MEKCPSNLQISQSQYVKDSIDALKLLNATAKKTAKSFTYRFEPKSIHSIEWTILGTNRLLLVQWRRMQRNRRK